MYLDKDLIEDKLCQIIDLFSERKFTSIKFYSILLNDICQFYNGNDRKCTILFANGEKKNNLPMIQKLKN